MCVCVCVNVCVCRELKQVFTALLWLVVSHGWGGGVKWNESYLPQPVYRAPVKTSCQKPTPAAFPLCLFQEILITRLRLHSVPRPLLQAHLPLYLEGRSSLCTYHLFWLTVFTPNTSRLLGLLQSLSRENENKPVSAPLQLPPASLVSLVFFLVWRIKNCLRCAFRKAINALL